MQVAALASLASAGVGAYGAIAGANQEAMNLKIQESQAKTQAYQTDKVYREDLMRQLSNIKAIRASTGASTSSPTFTNYMDENRKIGEEARGRRKAGFLVQAAQAKADQDLVRRMGWIRAAGGVVSGLGDAFSG